MIEKLNSQELNNILMNSLKEVETIKEQYNNIEEDISNKLNIVQIEKEYQERLILNNTNKEKNKIILSDLSLEKFGQYNSFGHTIHPRVAGMTIDIFNSQFEDKVLYKNNAEITVNGETENNRKLNYKNFLMKSGVIGKQYFIDKYRDHELTLEVKMDTMTLLGSSIVNTIEIDPFLQGSFDIESIKIYKSNNTNDYVELKDLKNIVQSRIILDEPVNFNKAVFNIRLKYKDVNDVYLFGLKSLRFLNIPYQKNSFVVAKFKYDKYIKNINRKININRASKRTTTTFYDENIQLFLDNTDGLLSYEIEPGITGRTQDIARNVNEVYIKIPLDKEIMSLSLIEVTPKGV